MNFLIVFLIVFHILFCPLLLLVETHLQRHFTAFHCLVEVQPKSTKVNALHTVQMTFDLAKCYFCHPHVSRIQLHFTFPGQDLVYMFVCLFVCLYVFYLRHFPLTFYLCCAWQYSALSR